MSQQPCSGRRLARLACRSGWASCQRIPEHSNAQHPVELQKPGQQIQRLEVEFERLGPGGRMPPSTAGGTQRDACRYPASVVLIAPGKRLAPWAGFRHFMKRASDFNPALPVPYKLTSGVCSSRPGVLPHNLGGHRRKRPRPIRPRFS